MATVLIAIASLRARRCAFVNLIVISSLFTFTIVLVGGLASLKYFFLIDLYIVFFAKWIFPSQKYLVSMAIFDKKLSLIILLVMPRHPKTGKRGKP